MIKVGTYALKIVKKIILSFCIIYAFNLIATGLNIFIPINIITIAVVTILGIPGMLSLIAIYYIL